MKPICMHGFHIINNLKFFVVPELETSKSKAAIFMMQIGSWFSFDVLEVGRVCIEKSFTSLLPDRGDGFGSGT